MNTTPKPRATKKRSGELEPPPPPPLAGEDAAAVEELVGDAVELGIVEAI